MIDSSSELTPLVAPGQSSRQNHCQFQRQQQVMAAAAAAHTLLSITLFVELTIRIHSSDYQPLMRSI